ncbi:hypothetical protein EDEG_01652 [Edhazardia aedis USNM 41457]|uniref:Uncharacterized protein n=1 Tax=Edhazardia aedis (strain USNM 41457) TaxID=1003232 RepID=J9D8K8_EDHAE|nr:hypothetical protein EDEG_01652 [Edhazardia aedis USNM 41457]|eukprot:EJW04076.1 hypothetical protein EDEG_01652 [Edhazardia aedis USNM 41457]
MVDMKPYKMMIYNFLISIVCGSNCDRNNEGQICIAMDIIKADKRYNFYDFKYIYSFYNLCNRIQTYFEDINDNCVNIVNSYNVVYGDIKRDCEVLYDCYDERVGARADFLKFVRNHEAVSNNPKVLIDHILSKIKLFLIKYNNILVKLHKDSFLEEIKEILTRVTVILHESYTVMDIDPNIMIFQSDEYSESNLNLRENINNFSQYIDEKKGFLWPIITEIQNKLKNAFIDCNQSISIKMFHVNYNPNFSFKDKFTTKTESLNIFSNYSDNISQYCFILNVKSFTESLNYIEKNLAKKVLLYRNVVELDVFHFLESEFALFYPDVNQIFFESIFTGEKILKKVFIRKILEKYDVKAIIIPFETLIIDERLSTITMAYKIKEIFSQFTEDIEILKKSAEMTYEKHEKMIVDSINSNQNIIYDLCLNTLKHGLGFELIKSLVKKVVANDIIILSIKRFISEMNLWLHKYENLTILTLYKIEKTFSEFLLTYHSIQFTVVDIFRKNLQDHLEKIKSEFLEQIENHTNSVIYIYSNDLKPLVEKKLGKGFFSMFYMFQEFKKNVQCSLLNISCISDHINTRLSIYTQKIKLIMYLLLKYGDENDHITFCSDAIDYLSILNENIKMIWADLFHIFNEIDELNFSITFKTAYDIVETLKTNFESSYEDFREIRSDFIASKNSSLLKKIECCFDADACENSINTEETESFLLQEIHNNQNLIQKEQPLVFETTSDVYS